MRKYASFAEMVMIFMTSTKAQLLSFDSSNMHYPLSDCNWIRTHNRLVHKRTLNHLAKV